MMHKKNFVAAIKVGGKVLRESSDRVEIPFGSEYSVLLKNLDTVRMQAQISIDGQNATGWLVVNPGDSVDIERFCRQNYDFGNRFKFIERTERIEQHRGVGAEDGLVRIEFKREKVYDPPKIVEHHTYHHHYYDYPIIKPCWTWPVRPYITWNTTNNTGDNVQKLGLLRSSTQHQAGQGQVFSCAAQEFTGAGSISPSSNTKLMASASVENDAGITVEGSISNQKFVSVADFNCEAPEVIVLHLVGRKGQAPIKVAKTVDVRLSCHTCGKKNKGIAKFCIECGTNLEKV